MKKNKRVDDPRKIAEIMRHIQIQRQASFRSPYTCMLVVFCYVLWKQYRYSQASLVKFTQDFSKYEEKWLKKPIKELDDRLMEYAGWKIEYVPATEKDFPRYQSVVLQKAIQAQIEDENRIGELSTRYLTYGFCVLADDGVKKQKLTNIKEKVRKLLDELDIISEKAEKEPGDKGIMDCWRELIDGAGIYIEKPVVD